VASGHHSYTLGQSLAAARPVHPILGLSDEAVASRKTADRDIIFGDEPAEGNFASDRYLPVAIHDFDLAPAMEGSIGRYIGSIEPVALKCNVASCRLGF
jgi:hypothetical protein